MKRFVPILSFLMIWATSSLAQQVSFTFKDGFYDKQLSKKMETCISALLTEFNNADREGRQLRLDGMKLSEKARRSLTYTWDSIATFTVDSDIYSSSCLTCVTGYEVREIYITYHPRKPAEYTGSLERELSIGFMEDGTITHAHVTLEDDTFGKVMGQGSNVTDMRCRMELLQFVESFRCFYEEKNIDTLAHLFSNRTILFNGKPSETARTRYIDSLKKVFAHNKNIKVAFKDIEIEEHPYKESFYGVSLKQKWEATNDLDGYIFMLWEFPDNGKPVMHAISWQQEKQSNGQLMDPKDKIGINDLFIPTLSQPQQTGVVDDLQYLIINVEPQNAIVTVDDRQRLAENGAVRLLSFPGEHTYRVQAPGYKSQSGTVVIRNEKTLLNVSLEKLLQTLVINYTPADATVLINMKPYQGNGHIECHLFPGQYRYMVAAQGYTTAEGTVIISGDKKQVLIVNLEKRPN